MGRQPLAGLLALVFLLTACGDSGSPPVSNSDPPPVGDPARGLVWERQRQDLGAVLAGEVHEVDFRFQVLGEGVSLSDWSTSCSCANPRLYLDGEERSLPADLPAGTEGKLRVEVRTAGFLGRKDAVLRLSGTGAGLPTELTVDTLIEPWFQLEPRALDLGSLDDREESVHEVVVRGPEAFRLDKVSYLPVPLRLEGVPSPKAATEHRLRVTIPPDTREGLFTDAIILAGDNGLDLVLPVRFTMEKRLFVVPENFVLFQAVRQGVTAQATVDVGVREGQLAPPEAAVEGIPGATTRVFPLENRENTFRILIGLPDNLDAGPVSGHLRLGLRHTVDGVEQRIDKSLRVTAIIQPAIESPPSR